MANPFDWGAVGSVMNLLTTELNSIADGSGSAYGPEVGAVNQPLQVQLSVHIASNSSAFTTSSYIKIYFVPSITTASGATYPTYTSGSSYKLAESNYQVATIFINPATQSANVVDEVYQPVYLPLGFFKTILVNKTGITWPSSGNTVNAYPLPTQY